MSHDRAQGLSCQSSNANRPTVLNLERLEARLLMTLDVLSSQIDQFCTSDMPADTAAQIHTGLQNSSQKLSQLTLSTGGQTIQASQRIDLYSTSLQIRVGGLNEQGQPLIASPKVSWIISSTDRQARASIRVSSNTATISFDRSADYQLVARSGSISQRFTVRVVAPATSLAVYNSANNKRIANNGLVSLSGSAQSFTVIGLGASGHATSLATAPVWSVINSPSGSSPSFQHQGNRTTVQFDRVGQYTFQVTNGAISSRLRVQVVATLSSIAVSPSVSNLIIGESLKFSASGLDQFQQPMTAQPKFTWSATGGSVSAQGLFKAGATPGNFQVVARTGKLTGIAPVRLDSPAPVTPDGDPIFTGINDPGIRSLMQSFYADGSVSRNEMIQLLRSAGNDNIVSSAELNDLRFIISPSSPFVMPDYVRGLASNVLHDNPANLKFQGQPAGNITSGSAGTLLNHLVDKWFLGVDLPALTSSNLSYRYAVGELFGGSPVLADSRQGVLGDCYFLASLVSIAQRDPSAIVDMFTDNADGTFTVRFFGGSLGLFWQGSLISAGFLSGTGVADYITVDRRLATFSNGVLAYSGYGLSALNPSTPLWLALAEKAYAQWNETGRAGRNGTNSFAGIEGGWMSDVNAQVLGTNSTYHVVNAASKQSMISALAADRAVTIGTNPTASVGGLVGSHAYVVTSYNALSDTFSLFNTWGTQHPTPLTWTQLLGQTSAFVIADPAGSLAAGGQQIQNQPQSSLVPVTDTAPLADRVSRTERVDHALTSMEVYELRSLPMESDESRFEPLTHRPAGYASLPSHSADADCLPASRIDQLLEKLLDEWLV